MSLGLLFWILMLLWFVSYGWGWSQAAPAWPQMGTSILLFLIILALGWQVFGAPIK